MRPESTNYKLALLILFASSAFILLMLSSSNLSNIQVSNPSRIAEEKQEIIKNMVPGCGKIPPSLADVLVHYAASNITPQQTFDEISVTMRVLQEKGPCKFLVFGLGHDSLMWASLNFGGRTVFLEEDKSWIEQVKRKHPSLVSYHVVYEHKLPEAEQLLQVSSRADECKIVTDPRLSKCERLAHKGLPSEVYDTEWDLIMVDAPTGWHPEAPGRMSAIYTVGLMAKIRAKGKTHVFVHDVDRPIEDEYSKAFFCQGYLKQQVGKLRHFIIPSHVTGTGPMPFCPPLSSNNTAS